MKSIILTFFVLCLACADLASASDKVLSIGGDTNSAKIQTTTKEQKFEWGALEINFIFEREGQKTLVSGWSLGVRKQSLRTGREVYITGGVFKDFKDFVAIGSAKWDFRIWGQIVYGIPGARFNRTVEKYENGELVGHQKIYLENSVDVPFQRIGKAGVLYPVMAMSLERSFGHINVEPIVGLRFMNFGFVESEHGQLIANEDGTVIVPSYGVRMGWKF